jgi:hypothetical protein
MDHRRKFACWSNPANRPDEGRLQFAAENIRDHAWTGEHLRLRKSQEIGKTYPRAILPGSSVKEDRVHRHWTKWTKKSKADS